MQGLRADDVVRDVLIALTGVLAAASVADPFSMLPLGLVPMVLVVVVSAMIGHRPDRLDAAAIAFWGWCELSVLWTVDPALTGQARYGLTLCVLLFLLARAIGGSRRGVLVVGSGFLFGCLVVVYEISGGNLSDVVNSAGVALRSQMDSPMTSSVNVNYASYSLAAAGAVATRMFAQWRVVRVTVLAGTCVAAAFLGSRGGFVACLAVAVWVILPSRVQRRALKPLALVVMFLVVAVPAGWLDHFLQRVAWQAGSIRDNGTLNGRLVLWPLARDLWSQRFMLGHGAGTFPEFNPEGVYAHDAILDIAAGTGLIGVATFAVVVYFVVQRMPRESVAVQGAFLLATVPPLLSGYWYLAPALWVVTGLLASKSGGDRDGVGAFDTAGPRGPHTRGSVATAGELTSLSVESPIVV